MADPIKCFLLEPTKLYQCELRRYRSDWRDNEPKAPCALPMGYHDASVLITPQIELAEQPASSSNGLPHDDPRWPTACGCGYVFRPEDEWQVNWSTLYRRSDTSELVTLREAPAGAIWDAVWYPEKWRRSDGHFYICRTPGGEWSIDGKCSNCTRPNEPHECWVRHGVAPNLHVDKAGNTCAAGAGSIIAGGWHGFLHNGFLVQC